MTYCQSQMLAFRAVMLSDTGHVTCRSRWESLKNVAHRGHNYFILLFANCCCFHFIEQLVFWGLIPDCKLGTLRCIRQVIVPSCWCEPLLCV